ncbi:pyrophosphate--fructose 6-phosphate 1-phosphotransferase subunit alpha [Olea europaea subsp. europaea]|uniref:Pyrophosphate--fructose 6-phosphate 1-phosphotransferase subunit alpha n=3 Tax=Olea europaea subsp. europaea TaxID=158383 RepID=A0A8S0THL8_OLEEU|nr:pyrophosphate--fructose 6-phosphate 1-phosphotransferase subunit alpha [Olea europaea subsp. europaea]
MDSDYGIPRELSDLQKLRSQYQPQLPPCLQGTTVRVEFGDATTAADPSGAHTISRSFPHTYGQPLAHFMRETAKVPDARIITEHPAIRVGVVFCGRQSPGGHNVIWGLLDALKVHNPNSTLLGFLGGSDGLFAQKTLEVTDDILATYKNQGGYDLLGRTKDQIRTTEQVNAALNACTSLKLDGLVIIGGVTSNTDAAQLAETFAERKCPTKVLGHIGYHILAAGLNGYMATVTNLKNPLNKWRCGAAPITSMMTVKRYGRGHGAVTLGKPALHPAAVDLKGKSYELLRQNGTKFLMDDVYRNPGPLQFEGPGADAKAVTLCVEDQDYMGRIKKLQGHLDKVRSIVKPGCSQDVLKAALSAMASVTDILSVMSSPTSGSTPY